MTRSARVSTLGQPIESLRTPWGGVMSPSVRRAIVLLIVGSSLSASSPVRSATSCCRAWHQLQGQPCTDPLLLPPNAAYDPVNKIIVSASFNQSTTPPSFETTLTDVITHLATTWSVPTLGTGDLPFELPCNDAPPTYRSEERRVGKECSSRWS